MKTSPISYLINVGEKIKKSLGIINQLLFCRRMAAAEVNGSSAPAKEEEEPMDVTTTHTENYQTLIDAGLPQKVAESLDNIFQTGGLCLFWLTWL